MSSAVIQSGPNFGWWYTTQALPNPSVHTNLSTSFDPGDPWYAKQDGKGPNGSRKAPNGRLWCTSRDVADLKAQTLQHEGVNPGWALSHYDFYVQEFARNNLNQVIEQVVGHYADVPSANDFANLVSRAQEDYIAPIDVNNEAVVDNEPYIVH